MNESERERERERERLRECVCVCERERERRGDFLVFQVLTEKSLNKIKDVVNLSLSVQCDQILAKNRLQGNNVRSMSHCLSPP